MISSNSYRGPSRSAAPRDFTLDLFDRCVDGLVVVRPEVDRELDFLGDHVDRVRPDVDAADGADEVGASVAVIRRTLSVTSAVATKASWRISIGVGPAWFACPSNVTFIQEKPNTPSTTATGGPPARGTVPA